MMILQVMTMLLAFFLLGSCWYAILQLKELKGFYKDSIEMDDQILKMAMRIEKRVTNLENRSRGL